MKIQRPRMLLVCLCFFTMIFTANAMAWNFTQASATNDSREDLLIPISTKARPIGKVKPQIIEKCKPIASFQQNAQTIIGQTTQIALPAIKVRGWELDAQALFARAKGKAIYLNNTFGAGFFGSNPQVDFNSAMGIPDHAVVGSFTAKYRFQPHWSLKYSILPTIIRGGGSGLGAFQFGPLNSTTGQQALKSKWERLYQQIGLVYDPIRTPTSRVGIFAEYVRINERISVFQGGASGGGTGGAKFDNDLNMAMVGVELEKLLKVVHHSNTLSLECSAGVAFCDDAVGSDLSTGLKYSVPLNNGRSGFLKGGYRYLTYKKNYSDAKMIDTAMDGGFLEMGFIF
ncbi:MAG: hypothetical protein ACP5VS_02485 [Desulfomonilaceae bacterium]